jgi:hypothetical protein
MSATAPSPSPWTPADFATLSDALANYVTPLRPYSWRNVATVPTPYTLYAYTPPSDILYTLPIPDGHTPPPDATPMTTPLQRDIATAHYHIALDAGRWSFQSRLTDWNAVLERYIRDTMAGNPPPAEEPPTPEEVARRAAVAADIAEQRAAIAAAEAERERRNTIMYVWVEPKTHDIFLAGTWTHMEVSSQFSTIPDVTGLLTAADLPAGITNDQLLRCWQLVEKIDNTICFTDSIRQQNRAHGFGMDDVSFHDPVLMALINERDALRAHFKDTMSAHRRRCHAILPWAVAREIL